MLAENNLENLKGKKFAVIKVEDDVENYKEIGCKCSTLICFDEESFDEEIYEPAERCSVNTTTEDILNQKLHEIFSEGEYVFTYKTLAKKAIHYIISHEYLEKHADKLSLSAISDDIRIDINRKDFFLSAISLISFSFISESDRKYIQNLFKRNPNYINILKGRYNNYIEKIENINSHFYNTLAIYNNLTDEEKLLFELGP